MIQVLCLCCQRPFLTFPSRIKKGAARYCSKACFTNAQKLPAVERKICTQCGVEKRLAEFTPRRLSGDGRTSVCRACRNAQIRAKRATKPKPPPPPRTPKEVRLWEKIIVRPEGCWGWAGTKNSAGYGQLRTGTKVEYAHRLVYIAAYGEIPEEAIIDHLCRTPECTRPDHLEIVTNAENSRRGLRTRLTKAEVREIRTLYASGQWLQRELAALFHVAVGTIGGILTYRRWVADMGDSPPWTSPPQPQA